MNLSANHRFGIAQISAVIAILLISFPLADAQTASDPGAEIEKYFQAARKAQEAGSFEIAEQKYLAVLRLDPNMPEAFVNLGLAYFSQGKNEESASALEKARQLRPQMRGVDLYLGMDYVKLSRPAKAIPLLLSAIQLEPNSKEAQMWLGTALWDAGRHMDALQQIRKTAAAFPSDPDVLFVYGEAYRKAANEEIAAAISAAGRTPLTHQIYGDIYTAQQAWDKAAGHYRLALEKDPHWVGAHFGLANVYIAQNKMGDASEELSHELEVDPLSAAAEALLGDIALLQGRPQDALPRLRAAIGFDSGRAAFALGIRPPHVTNLEPITVSMKDNLMKSRDFIASVTPGAARSLALSTIDNEFGDEETLNRDWADYTRFASMPREARSSFERAQSDFYRSKYDEAEARLNGILASRPNDAEARYLRARVYAEISLSALRQLLATSPNSFRTHELLAQTYENRNESDKALAEYRIVEQMTPTLPGLHFSIGHLLWTNGDPNQAMTELKQELQLNRDNPEANAEIGTILVSQHDAQNAVEYLERALRVSPDLFIVHLELGKAFYLMRDYSKAEVELRQAIKFDKDGDAHYQLGVVYRSLGRQAEAEEQFEVSRSIKAKRLEEAELKPINSAGELR